MAEAEDRYGYISVVGAGDTMVPALNGQNGFREIDKMVQTDDTIGAMMWTTETQLAQVKWSHEPRDNGRPSSDPRAQEAANFANELLADMAHSFGDHVEDTVTMIPYGFEVAEIQIKRRDGKGSRFNDGYWGVDCLLHLEQKATSGWDYNDGKAVAYKTMTTSGEKTVPLFKAMHYTIRGNVTKPQGRTLFSNMHRSWTFKNNLQESEAIGARRELAGLPRARVPKADMDLALKGKLAEAAGGQASVDQKAAMERIKSMLLAATRMRFNETAGMVLPSDPFPNPDGDGLSTIRQYDFDIMTSAGQRTVDTNSAIGRYDRAIARCLLMQFLHLGDRSTGSYNLSENQSSLALRSMRALIGKILGEWQRKVLRLIWAMNGMDTRWLPELVSSPLTEDDLGALGKFLDSLANAMDLLNQEPDLKTAMFQRVGVKPNEEVEPQLPQDRPDPAVNDPTDPVDA